MLKNLIIILVFISAFFVLVSRQPEQVFTKSSDGVIEVQGLSRTVRSVTIEPTKEFGSVLKERVSSYYFLVPVPAGVPFTADVRVNVLEQWKQIQPDLTELAVYKWNEFGSKWEVVPTVVDLSKETLEVRIELQEPTWIAIGVL